MPSRPRPRLSPRWRRRARTPADAEEAHADGGCMGQATSAIGSVGAACEGGDSGTAPRVSAAGGRLGARLCRRRPAAVQALAQCGVDFVETEWSGCVAAAPTCWCTAYRPALAWRMPTRSGTSRAIGSRRRCLPASRRRGMAQFTICFVDSYGEAGWQGTSRAMYACSACSACGSSWRTVRVFIITALRSLPNAWSCFPHTRSITIAMPWPTPMHIVHSA